MNFTIARFLITISSPLDLLGGVLLYALGVGIARYLGSPIDWAVVILGQGCVSTYQLGFHFLSAYFILPAHPRTENRISIPTEDENRKVAIRRDLLLWTSFASLAVTTSLTLILLQTEGVDGSILILLGLLLLGAILYSVPPFRLIVSGYGELIRSIIMANIIPALAFMLQHGEIHRLVGMSTFPLTMVHLSMLLAIQLPDYFQNLKAGNQTLLVRLGWERGMILHNMLILSAFLLVGIAILFGLPSSIALPVFLVFPLGLFQIWYMTRIATGNKPNWQVLRFTAILTFGLAVYILAFSYWIR